MKVVSRRSPDGSALVALILFGLVLIILLALFFLDGARFGKYTFGGVVVVLFAIAANHKSVWALMRRWLSARQSQ